MLPRPLQERYNELPSRRQNNLRSMFLRDWGWANGNETREKVFAEKWGLYYDGKYTGEAFHPDPNFKISTIKDWNELSEQELNLLLELDIY